MKKMILKVSLFAFLTLGIVKGQAEASQLQDTYQDFSWKGQKEALCSQKEYELLYGFHSIEGLKAHWLTLERLLGTFPTKKTMLGSIERHSCFKEGPVYLKGKLLKNFEIYKKEDEFEVSNGVGLRHFRVRICKVGSREVATLKNGQMRIYPDLERFLSESRDYNFFA